MKHDISLSGVCPVRLEFELDNNIVRNVKFTGGCNGNLKAVSKLTDGMPAEKIESILLGNTCGMRDTSCADQFAKAVREAYNAEKELN